MAGLLRCCHFRMRGPPVGAGLSGPLQPHGMVRHIFMKVSELEKQFEHPVAVLRLGIACFLFEVLDDCERVREEPLDIRGVHRATFAAAAKSLVRAKECVVQKMLEAKLLGRKSRWNRIRTR
jgi:hypothetical protein